MSQLMNTGDVGKRMGIVGITGDLLESLGFQPVERVKRAMYWAPADYPAMCEAVGNWIKTRRDVPMPTQAEKDADKAAKKAAAAKKILPPAPPPATQRGNSFDDDDEEL
jgi:hypothetical protein